MTTYSPNFNVNQFELRGETGDFYNSDQFSSILDATRRVPAQLDWLGQLLGWSGDNYWNSLNLTVDQKRQLLGGSFGIYNGFLYPEIVEIRNWSNQVIIKYSNYVKEGQTFYLGDYDYIPESIEKEGDNLVLNFKSLTDQFIRDIANNLQLKFISSSGIPSPFVRSNVGVSGDRSFICNIDGDSLTLFPSYDTGKTLPYVFNTFFLGSRYYFSLPVKLIISDDLFIAPTYNFASENWYIDIPCELTVRNTEITARLDYEGSFLIINILRWSDPSDWVDKDKATNFRGVWGNKGGFLPFHFSFDSLSLHGFDERKSLYLQPVTRNLDFDVLLNSVYQQQTQIDSLPPPVVRKSQVWWNSQTGKFSIYPEDSLNCGPWVEREYYTIQEQDLVPDIVFPDVEAFRDYIGGFFDGVVVQIIDCSGLDSTDNVLGLVSPFPLTSAGQVILLKPEGSEGWVALRFVYDGVAQFNTEDGLRLPPNTEVDIMNGDGLSPSTPYYEVKNLKITVSGEYKVSLMKYDVDGSWYLSPPSEFKYIGDTRLFQSSLDYDNPVEGEMTWDYDNPDVKSRTAAIFYYNRWEYNSLLSSWELKGDWVSINDGCLTGPPPTVVEFDTILVYCNGQLLSDGVALLTNDFQITYSINQSTGKFEFSYYPRDYKGMVNLPKIKITDSLTTSFNYDITDLVFSGLQYYMSPNVEDSETLLRIWKPNNLFCVDDLSDNSKLSYPNGLVADLNTGPLSINWDRYFIRLAPSYQRNGAAWQKINLLCQDFGYFGSPSSPEDMSCPAQESKPEIYEEVALLDRGISPSTYIYSEPYLYSNVVLEYGGDDDYNNAAILPSFTPAGDTYVDSEVIDYDPLHERKADTTSPMGKGYGDWLGEYYRTGECSFVTGHLITDIVTEVLDPLLPPVWDASIYKLPSTCLLDQSSGYVDANHYRVGYAFFAADLSSAEEAVFNFG